MPRVQDSMTVTKNGQVLKTVPLGAEVTVGRHQTAMIQLEDPLMSRVHLRIIKKSDGMGEHYYVVDNRSTNGSFLNGKKLLPDVPELLDANSVVRCACFEIHFALNESDLTSTLAMHKAPEEQPAPEVVTEPPPVEAPPPTSPLLSHLVDSRSRIPVWTTGDATLAVVNIIEETHDAKTFRFTGSDPTQPMLFSLKRLPRSCFR